MVFQELEWGNAEPYSEITASEVPGNHPVARFNSYWTGHRRPGQPLGRAEFRPDQLVEVLPWLLVLENSEDEQWRYRLCGTGCTRIFQIDFTGKVLGDDLPPESAEMRRREFAVTYDQIEPVFSQTRVPIPGREFIEIIRGVFPVVDLTKPARQVFVVIAPHQVKLR